MGEPERDEVKRSRDWTEKARGSVRCQGAKDRAKGQSLEKGFDLGDAPEPASLGAWRGAVGWGARLS